MAAINRCGWCGDDALYVAYHDQEWGYPQYDARILFEFLILEGVQAGLSWITVLRKRENYREAFDAFDPEKIARYGKRKINQLLKNEGIVRNRLKIESAVNNAQRFLAIEETGSFSDYLWSFVDGKPIQNRFSSLSEVPAKTPISDTMSKTLKKDGFNFVGSTICYAHMQATGMVNDHILGCHRYKTCKAASR
ncbi:MAG TPA: DNA-3-methyladenine glycosylase I [Pseudomonadales bacterium]|nr:DNA-3-methyladenine glycosylase I [Pseudomonadales bacterium]